MALLARVASRCAADTVDRGSDCRKLRRARCGSRRTWRPARSPARSPARGKVSRYVCSDSSWHSPQAVSIDLDAEGVLLGALNRVRRVAVDAHRRARVPFAIICPWTLALEHALDALVAAAAHAGDVRAVHPALGRTRCRGCRGRRGTWRRPAPRAGRRDPAPGRGCCRGTARGCCPRASQPGACSPWHLPHRFARLRWYVGRLRVLRRQDLVRRVALTQPGGSPCRPRARPAVHALPEGRPAASWTRRAVDRASFSACGNSAAARSAWQSVHARPSWPCTDFSNRAASPQPRTRRPRLASGSLWHIGSRHCRGRQGRRPAACWAKAGSHHQQAQDARTTNRILNRLRGTSAPRLSKPCATECRMTLRKTTSASTVRHRCLVRYSLRIDHVSDAPGAMTWRGVDAGVRCPGKWTPCGSRLRKGGSHSRGATQPTRVHGRAGRGGTHGKRSPRATTGQTAIVED